MLNYAKGIKVNNKFIEIKVCQHYSNSVRSFIFFV